MNKKINYKYLNILLLLGIAYLLFLMKGLWFGVVEKLFNIALPFIIAFLIAYVLYPFMNYLIKKKIPKTLAIFIVILTVVSIFGFSVYFAVPVFFNQLINLLANLGKISTDIATKYNIDLSFINDAISKYSTKIIDYIGIIISDGTIFNIVNKSIDFITKFIIVSISSIYFLADMPNINLKVKKYLFRTNKKRYYLISNLNKEVYSYLKGLLIFMIIQFFEYTILFLIIGHPNFLLIGVLASITTIIPYFGGLITNILALLIASVISPKLFVLTLIITIVCPNIDGYIISPKIYGKTNQLPALLSIFSVFAGGALFGFYGIVIAVPLTIIILSIYKSYKKEISNKIKNIKTKKRNVIKK